MRRLQTSGAYISRMCLRRQAGPAVRELHVDWRPPPFCGMNYEREGCSMPHIFQLEMRAHLDKVDEFVEFMRTNFADSLKHEGCISVTPLRDLDDPSRFVFLQKWASPANYQHYIEWRTETGTRVPEGVLSAPRAITVLTEIASLDS
jgi:quinol monooxygenase YgiN